MNNQEIEVVLRNPSEYQNTVKELALYFTPQNTPIAVKYLQALEHENKKGGRIDHPRRFYNFPGDNRDQAWIADQINQCFDIINRYKPGIVKHRASATMDQELMNELHKYFEILRGNWALGTHFYDNAPPEVCNALNELNIYIHRYEDCAANDRTIQEGSEPNRMFIANFVDVDRFSLADEDYQHFTRQFVFGGWYLDYVEVGKHLLELFWDNDGIVGEDAIRPQRFYSADAIANFRRSSSDEDNEWQLRAFDKWWDENETKLSRLGFVKNDPKNALGCCAIANLNRNRGQICGLSEVEICHLVGQHAYISRINIVPAIEKPLLPEKTI